MNHHLPHDSNMHPEDDTKPAIEEHWDSFPKYLRNDHTPARASEYGTASWASDTRASYSLDAFNNQAPKGDLKSPFTSDESGQDFDRYMEGLTGSFNLQAADYTTQLREVPMQADQVFRLPDHVSSQWPSISPFHILPNQVFDIEGHTGPVLGPPFEKNSSGTVTEPIPPNNTFMTFNNELPAWSFSPRPLDSKYATNYSGPAPAQHPSVNDDTNAPIGFALNSGTFKCNVNQCAHKCFSRFADLQRHYRTTHALQKPAYHCEFVFCERSAAAGGEPFRRRYRLQNHLNKMHPQAADPRDSIVAIEGESCDHPINLE